jgi:RimJ/RimL family protein N-acetyltransferase
MDVPASERIVFRRMTDADLDDMAALLGDAEAMKFYPRPKTRDEARDWITWNHRNYAEYGYGLWVIETPAGEFIGDCGLTWQPVGERRELEVGYHVRRALQGQGYATDAAEACREFARATRAASHLVAIINPENLASRRVAEKIGLRLEEELDGERPSVVYGATLH